ncbi:MAG: CinA family protein [Clostridiales bacterium]|nr:CinA family protein [Clostridiales bacterium]
MSTDKFLLLILRNKKINEFENADKLILSFGNSGYWFDKISYIDYGNSQSIVQAVEEGKSCFENAVIFYPSEMDNLLRSYIEKSYSAKFDSSNCLLSGNKSVFLLSSGSDGAESVNNIVKIFNNKYGKSYLRAYIKTVGAPNDKISEALAKAKEVCGDVDFCITEKYGECSIEIIYGSDMPKTVYDGVMRALLVVLKDYVYALEDITLAERLVELLKLRRMKICVAESFTGGGVSKRLVEVSGVSEVFCEGLNTYSNQSKEERLGVKKQTLSKYGAVSEQVAAEMAEGLILSGNCDVSISTTGIAGPNSDNTNKPVGLFYIGIATKESTQVYKYNLKGSRKSITETAINFALFLAYKLIK